MIITSLLFVIIEIIVLQISGSVDFEEQAKKGNVGMNPGGPGGYWYGYGYQQPQVPFHI